MTDPILIAALCLAGVLLLLFVIGKRESRTYRVPKRWRKALSGSLWAASAMMFGGVADPVEKGKVVKVRKRDLDDGEDSLD